MVNAVHHGTLPLSAVGMAASSYRSTKEVTVSEASSDPTANPDKTATPGSSRPASSPDELVEDLEFKLTDEQQRKVVGGEKVGPDHFVA
jgi:hypothetical protein